MALAFPDWDRKVLKFAKSQGGEVLTPPSQVTTALAIVRLRCSKNHVWNGLAYRVAEGSWCRICADEEVRTNSYKRILEALSRKNAICLVPFERFKTLSQKLTIRCKKCGFEYKRAGIHVLTAHGCRKCFVSPLKMPIETVRRVATLRGGELLSKEYIDNDKKLLWRCERGHRWEAAYRELKRGAWCPHCAIAARTKYSIETAHELAAKHGGKCLSKKYLGYKGRLRWECKKGHRWEVLFATVCRGAWCARCAKDNLRWTVVEMKDLAKKRTGNFYRPNTRSRAAAMIGSAKAGISSRCPQRACSRAIGALDARAGVKIFLIWLLLPRDEMASASPKPIEAAKPSSNGSARKATAGGRFQISFSKDLGAQSVPV